MTEVTTDFAISYLLDDCYDCPENKDGECMTQSHCFEVKQMAIKALRQEKKTGHWISHREHCKNLGVMPSGLGAYEWCSNCDCGIDVREWHKNNYNYCPNCGCRMVELQESEG